MITSQIFKEVISQRLSPLVLTGDHFFVLNKFSQFLLKSNVLKFIIISSKNVAPGGWQKLLKTFEDNIPNTQIIIISDKNIPESIKTRSFRCHVPSVQDVERGYSGTEAFSVGSWLISVDTRNREQLLKCCQEWSSGHTSLLIAELNEQLSGNSIMSLTLDKRLANPNRLMAALFILNEYKDVPTSHIYAGLRLMI